MGLARQVADACLSPVAAAAHGLCGVGGLVLPGLVQRPRSSRAGIIYCLTKKDCETLAQELQSLGLRAG